MSLRRHARVLTLALALGLGVSGACGARSDLRRVQQLDTDDPLVRTRAAVSASAARPGHGATRRLALAELQALVDRVGAAPDPSASWGELSERLAALDAALVVAERARSSGVAPEPADVLRSARADLVEALIAANLAGATAALAEGSFAVAVVRLEQSQALGAGDPETAATLASVRRTWAAADLEQGRLRDAAERLARSGDPSPEALARDRAEAAELFRSLGQSALDRGACRAAHRDLLRAADLGVQSAAALTAAALCARTAVSVSVDLHPSAPLPAFEARLLEQLRHLGSVHLKVVPSDAAAEPRKVPAGPDGPPRSEGPYEVQVTVGLPAFRTQPPRSITRTVTQRAMVRCLDPYGTPWPAPCDVDLRVTFEEVREVVDGEVGAVLRVVAGQTPPQDLARFPLRVTAQDVASWRGDLLSVSSIGAYGSTTSMPWQPRTSAATRSREPRALARERLLDQLSVNLADRVAREILAALDVERTVPDRRAPGSAPGP